MVPLDQNLQNQRSLIPLIASTSVVTALGPQIISLSLYNIQAHQQTSFQLIARLRMPPAVAFRCLASNSFSFVSLCKGGTLQTLWRVYLARYAEMTGTYQQLLAVWNGIDFSIQQYIDPPDRINLSEVLSISTKWSQSWLSLCLHLFPSTSWITRVISLFPLPSWQLKHCLNRRSQEAFFKEQYPRHQPSILRLLLSRSDIPDASHSSFVCFSKEPFSTFYCRVDRFLRSKSCWVA